VLETELDVGQTPGNAYEQSKMEAEKLVRAAEWIDSPTIYRPSIIVGDSRTGYTTTFHGFYVMVKLAHTLVSRMVRGSTAGDTWWRIGAFGSGMQESGAGGLGFGGVLPIFFLGLSIMGAAITW